MDDQNEMFVVVNNNDKIIEYRTRYDCHHNKKLIHRSVGIVVFNDKNQILLQKRGKNKYFNPGRYSISSAGHVNKGETYRQATQRELTEELGIQTSLKKSKKYLVKLVEETEICCLFTVRHNGPFSPNKQEVDKIEFVDIISLPRIQSKLTPFAISALKQLSIL